MGRNLPFEAGQTLGERYVLHSQLGEGGMGVVWRAWQSGVERPVAIKFLKKAGGDIQSQRFELEAQALGRLSHPNCVTVYDFGFSEAHKAYYLVTEFLEGTDLSAWRGRQMPLGDVLEVTKQVTNGLAYAHHHGIAHRDLKPENVFLIKDFAGHTTVKVIDFGLAKMSMRESKGLDLTRSGEIFGTPAYMSPEQIRGTRDAGPSSDLYSLGVMLYEMVEGRLPFDGTSSFEIVTAHVTKPPAAFQRHGTPRALLDVVSRLLAKDPQDRFPSALALYDALAEIQPRRRLETTQEFTALESPHKTLSDVPLETVPMIEVQTTAPRVPAEESATVPVALVAEAPREPANRPKTWVWFAAAALLGGTVAVGAALMSGDSDAEELAEPTPEVATSATTSTSTNEVATGQLEPDETPEPVEIAPEPATEKANVVEPDPIETKKPATGSTTKKTRSQPKKKTERKAAETKTVGGNTSEKQTSETKEPAEKLGIGTGDRWQ